MSMSPYKVDNLVIGGGPAGSLVAILLANAGRQVTLVEKESAPHHKVCGEFLSREAVGYLDQARVAPSDLGAAGIRAVRLSSGQRTFEARLPFQALSLSRFTLDAAMLARAEESGCEVRRGAMVEGLTAHGDEWLVRVRGGELLQARTVFLASGKHDIRGWDRSRGKQSDLVGFKMHWRLDAAQTEALRQFMELFLFPGGYGGLSLVEGEGANLCLVVRRSRLRRIGGWTELLASILAGNPHLQKRLHGAIALWERPLAISPIPYGHLAERSSGVWRLGDQAAVIPSFTGDGMSIALHSAALATQMYLAGQSADAYNLQLRAQLSRSMWLATLLSRAMVTGIGRGMAPLGLLLCPNAMGWIATSTRIPEHSLIREITGTSAGSGVRKERMA